MDELIMAVDMSLRSTGVVVIDAADDSLVHYELIKTDPMSFPDDEQTIMHYQDRFHDLLLKFMAVKQFVIEKPALGAKSSRKDVIAGAYWAVRSVVYRYFPHVLIGTVTVNTWRNWLTTKEERKVFDKACQDPLKNVVVSKLPDDVWRKFVLYVEENSWDWKSVFDISDAYGLALYRSSLNK